MPLSAAPCDSTSIHGLLDLTPLRLASLASTLWVWIFVSHSCLLHWVHMLGAVMYTKSHSFKAITSHKVEVSRLVGGAFVAPRTHSCLLHSQFIPLP